MKRILISQAITLACILAVPLVIIVANRHDRASLLSEVDQAVALSFMEKCYHDGSTECYKNASVELDKRFEIEAILNFFEQNEAKPAVFSRCHEVTHYLGRKEYERTLSVPEAFATVSEVCHGGSFHGVIEGYFMKNGITLTDIERLEREALSVCGRREDFKLSSIYGECVHGIGHAMMFVTDSELGRSLELCDTFSSREEQITCYGGVFMENSSSSTNQDHPSKYILASDPLYPCNSLSERYLETCYSYQSSHFSQVAQFDWAKVATLCASVPVEYQDGCYRVMGTNQVGFTQNKEIWKKDCDQAPSGRPREKCYNGVIDGLVGRFHRDFSKVSSFCLILPEENKDSCYELIGRAMIGWVSEPKELEKLCSTVERGYSEACLRALERRG